MIQVVCIQEETDIVKQALYEGWDIRTPWRGLTYTVRRFVQKSDGTVRVLFNELNNLIINTDIKSINCNKEEPDWDMRRFRMKGKDRLKHMSLQRYYNETQKYVMPASETEIDDI